MQDSLLNIANRELHDDANRFLVGSVILFLDLPEELFGIFLIGSHLSTCNALFVLWVSLNDAEADHFISILHHVLDKPFEGMLGIGILVDGYKENALVPFVGVAVVLADQCELLICNKGIIECIEGDP